MRDFMAIKRPPVLVDGVAWATIEQVSKDGLIDLVTDLLRAEASNAGTSDFLNGRALAVAFVKHYRPVAVARMEKPPKVWRSTAWKEPKKPKVSR